MTAFLDSNILIYAITESDRRCVIAKELLSTPFVVSTQSLNELIHVGRRKLRLNWAEIDYALLQVITAAIATFPVLVTTQRSAVAFSKRYGFAIYDSQIIASALEAECDTLYSEDMHDGVVVENRLTIRNPFK